MNPGTFENLSGSLQSTSLSELLVKVGQAAFSGVLYLRHGDQRRRLYFSQGALAMASSTVPGERPGDLALARKFCTESVLFKLTEESRAQDKPLLKILEDRGYITAAQHDQLLCEVTERIAFEAGTAQDSEWQLVPGSLPPEVARPSAAEQPLWALIVQSYSDWHLIYGTLGDLQTTLLVMSPNALKHPTYKDLSFAQKQLLSLFSKEKPLLQVSRGKVMSRTDELLTLARAASQGMLKVTKIDIEGSAPSELVEPEATVRLHVSDFEAVAAAKKGAKAVAPTADEPARKRQKAQELKAQAQAEQSKSGANVKKGLELLRQAIQLDPDSIDLYLSAAELLLKTPKGLDEAEGYCQKALVLDDSNGKAHLLLGKIYIALRRFDDAKNSLESALALDQREEASKILSTMKGPDIDPSKAKNRVRMTVTVSRQSTGGLSIGAVLGLLIFTGLWGFGLYRFVFWRLDQILGPMPEKTVLSAPTSANP